MEHAERNEGQSNIRVRPGYTEQIRDNQTYIRPSVLDPTADLSLLAMTRKADLSQAVEMPGGVSSLFNCVCVRCDTIYIDWSDSLVRARARARFQIRIFRSLLRFYSLITHTTLSSQVSRQSYTPIQWVRL